MSYREYIGAAVLGTVSAATDWKSTVAIGIGSFAAWLAHAALSEKRIEAVARRVLKEHMEACKHCQSLPP
jgi:hypothetical protein